MKPIYTLLLLLMPITLIAQVQDLEYTVFDSSNGFVDDKVSALYTDSNGTVWIGTYNNGIYTYANEEFTHYEEDENDFLTGRPSVFLEDDNGDMWIGFYHEAYGGVMRYDGEEFTAIYTTSDEISIGRVIDLMFTSDGDLCILETANFYNSHTFNMVKQDTIESYAIGEVDEYSFLSGDMLQTADGSIWIDSNNELKIYKDGILKGDSIPLGMPFDEHIRKIEQDDNGMIWVIDYKGDLFITDAEGHFWTYVDNYEYSPTYLLDGDNCLELYKDTHGRVWVYSNYGNSYLSCFDNGYYYVFEGFEISGGIVEDLSNNLWLGTNDNQLIRIDNVAPDEVILPSIPPFTTKTSLIDVGIDTSSLAHYERIVYGINHLNILSMFIDSQDRIWLGDFDQLLCIENDSLTEYHYFSNKAYDYMPLNGLIKDIAEDTLGNIWFAVSDYYEGGLYKYDGEQLSKEYVKGNNSLFSLDIYCLYIDPSTNDKWVSTGPNFDSEMGVQIIQLDSVWNYPSPDSMLTEFAFVRDIKKNPSTGRIGLSSGTVGYFEIDSLETIYDYEMPYDVISSFGLSLNRNIEYGGGHDIWLVSGEYDPIYYDEDTGWDMLEITDINGSIGYLKKDSRNNIWIKTFDWGDLYKVRDDEWVLVEENLGNTANKEIDEDKDGNIWVVGDDGLVQLKPFPIMGSIDGDNIDLQEQKLTTSTENNINTYKIYPNPVGNLLTIKGVKDPLYYQLYDIRGSIVSIEKLNNNQIDVSDYNAGIYSLILFNEDHLSVHKIIVK